MSEYNYQAAVDEYLALLPMLTERQWDAAWAAARDAARDAAWDAARAAARAAARDAAWDAAWAAARDAAWDAAWDAARAAAWAAEALVVRDLIAADQFESLVAPMRAAGIDFDALLVAST